MPKRVKEASLRRTNGAGARSTEHGEIEGEIEGTDASEDTYEADLDDTNGAGAEKQKRKSEKSKARDKSKADGSTKLELKEGMWWRAEEMGRKPHEILDNVVKQIEDDQASRYDAYKEYERLFGATEGPWGDSSYRAIASDELIQNELQNTLETLWAQIFKNKVVPGVATSEADFDEWDRARSYSRWLEGAFDEAKVYEEVFPKAGMHMLVHGTGFIRVGWKETEDEDVANVKCWAVNPRYVAVDRIEAKHGKPRNIYFKDHWDRSQLFETYGYEDEDCCLYGTVEERRAGINKAQGNDDIELGSTSITRCDMVTVREAFHLPSGPRAKDGRHVIWIKGCTLVDEPYEWDRLPCVVMRFGCPMEGFYGESAVKRLAPTQAQFDKLNLKLDEAQDVMGVPRILVGNNGNGLKHQHLDDVPGGVLVVEDINQVSAWNAQCATPELYAERDQAPRRMRGLLGISDFEASSQLPAGLRDVGAPFMEHFVEQGQARHAMSHAQYENAVPELAYLFMLQAEELQEMGYDVVVKSPTGYAKSSIETLSFEEVCVDRKRLKVQVQPMSQLPRTFAGKVEAFAKMREKGLPISDKTILRNLEIPDIHAEADLLGADEEIILKNLAHMCKTGEYLPPLPFDNLDLIIQLTSKYINRYRVREGRDMNRVALLAQYIDDAINLKKGLGGPDPSAPPALGGVGPMLPGAPPMVPPGMAPPVPPGPMGAAMPPPGMPPPPMGPPPPAGPMGPGAPPMM